MCISSDLLLSTGGPLANEAPIESQEVQNPRIEERQHEAAEADARNTTTVAQRLEEERAGQSVLIQGRRDADIAVAQAGILGRPAQGEKAVQGHASKMAVWQSEEEREDVPHAGVPPEAPQNVQYAVATGQQGEVRSVDAPQRLAAVEVLSSRSQLIQPIMQASGSETGQFHAKLNHMKKLLLFHGNRLVPS